MADKIEPFFASNVPPGFDKVLKQSNKQEQSQSLIYQNKL